MKINVPNVFTPIYLKLDPHMPWPEHEKVFYLLTRDGSFLCRNHKFFRSSVPAEKLSADLAAHEPFLNLNCPKIPQRLLEKTVGFFDIIGERHGGEAAAIFVWNTKSNAVEVVVPPQVSIVNTSSRGTRWPIEVHYEIPLLPPHLIVIGDIHCHVDDPAYASYKDKTDETHRPGIHIVVGRIYREPPEFHLEMVVDGSRFELDGILTVADGYSRRRTHEVPQSWIDQVTVSNWASYFEKRKNGGDTQDNRVDRPPREHATTSPKEEPHAGRNKDAAP